MKRFCILSVIILCSVLTFGQGINSQTVEEVKERADLGDLDACLTLGNYYYDLFKGAGDANYSQWRDAEKYYEKWLNSNPDPNKLDSIGAKAIYGLYQMYKDKTSSAWRGKIFEYLDKINWYGPRKIELLRDFIDKDNYRSLNYRSLHEKIYKPAQRSWNEVEGYKGLLKIEDDIYRLNSIANNDKGEDLEVLMMLGYIFGKKRMPYIKDSTAVEPNGQKYDYKIVSSYTDYLESYQHYKKALDGGLKISDYDNKYVENYKFIEEFANTYRKTKDYKFNTKLSLEEAYVAMFIVEHLWSVCEINETKTKIYGETLNNIVDAVYFNFPSGDFPAIYSYKGRILYYGLFGNKVNKKRGRELLKLGMDRHEPDCYYAMAKILKDSNPDESRKLESIGDEINKRIKEAREKRLQEEEQKRKEDAEALADELAENGDADAKILRGDDFLETDVLKAVSWYKKAAEQGSPKGFYKITLCYIGKNNEAALKYLNMAVEKGLNLPLVELGGLYLKCGDSDKAEECYIKAAETGDLESIYTLGMFYQEKNQYEKAFEAFSKAAQKGHGRSQERVGWYYKKGLGVDGDYDKAIGWLEKATAQGKYREDWLEWDKSHRPENKKEIRNRMTQLQNKLGISGYSEVTDLIVVGRSFGDVKEYLSLSKSRYSFKLSIDKGSRKCYDIILNSYKVVKQGFVWVSNGKITSVSWH